MSTSKAFKLICGGLLVVTATAYSQTAAHTHGAVVFLLASATFLVGHFAGEDC